MPPLDSSVPTSSVPSPTLEDAILATLRGTERKSLSAPEIAHAITQRNAQERAQGNEWHALLVPIRRAAIALAQAGRLVIYRHGKPVDPNDFRGVYRLGLPRQD